MYKINKRRNLEPQYPMDPALCQRLQPLFEQEGWVALLEWLEEQEEALLVQLKLGVGETIDKAALTAAQVGGTLKLIGRLKSLEEVVSQILTKDAAHQQAKALLNKQ